MHHPHGFSQRRRQRTKDSYKTSNHSLLWTSILLSPPPSRSCSAPFRNHLTEPAHPPLTSLLSLLFARFFASIAISTFQTFQLSTLDQRPDSVLQRLTKTPHSTSSRQGKKKKPSSYNLCQVCSSS